MITRIKNIVENIAKTYDGEGIVEFIDGYDALINNDEVVNMIKETAERPLGKDKIQYKEFPSLGAEDFSYFANAAKGGFSHLGC